MLIEKLKRMQIEIRYLRDNQTLIKCEDKDDICNYFDNILDSIEDLIIKINKDVN